ncbi:MAG: endonuclease/exonuclease/phosphatase family protein [Bacteroidaceae bacterium]|nr:endonuclease/exonuclease/phosphatase family protein [Bacteroidaceae bacterium]
MKRIILLILLLAPLCCNAGKKQPCNVRWCSFNLRVNTKEDIPKGASWETRRDRCCQYLKDSNIDVVGFQEVTTSMLPDLVERLPEYGYVAQGRLNREDRDEMTPVFYRKDKYDLLDSGHFWLSETPDVPASKGWDTSVPRIASWVKLKDKATGKVFVALSTHFDHKGHQARIESGKLLQKMMVKIAGKHPAMLAGDFNMTDTTPGYAAIVGGPFVLRDAYYMSPEHEGVRYSYQAFSTIPPEKGHKIDFIFVTSQVEVLHTCITKDVPDAPLSDHNPHWADLRF